MQEKCITCIFFSSKSVGTDRCSEGFPCFQGLFLPLWIRWSHFMICHDLSRHVLSWKITICHEMAPNIIYFNLTWWHFMTHDDIWWHFMTWTIFQFNMVTFDDICHDMSRSSQSGSERWLLPSRKAHCHWWTFIDIHVIKWVGTLSIRKSAHVDMPC